LGRQRITARNWSEVKREVVEPLFREYVRYDESYDHETIHGADRKAQAEWDRQIDQQLDNPGDYFR
jgi:hypothetical protein